MTAAIEKDGMANLRAAAKAGEHRDPREYPMDGRDNQQVVNVGAGQ
jgi:hypothetical protein